MGTDTAFMVVCTVGHSFGLTLMSFLTRTSVLNDGGFVVVWQSWGPTMIQLPSEAEFPRRRPVLRDSNGNMTNIQLLEKVVQNLFCTTFLKVVYYI